MTLIARSNGGKIGLDNAGCILRRGVPFGQNIASSNPPHPVPHTFCPSRRVVKSRHVVLGGGGGGGRGTQPLDVSVLHIYEVKGPLERSSCNVITVRFSCSDRLNVYISRKTVAAEVQAFVE